MRKAVVEKMIELEHFGYELIFIDECGINRNSFQNK